MPTDFFEETLAQLCQAERKRDEAAAHMDELLAEFGYARWVGVGQ